MLQASKAVAVAAALLLSCIGSFDAGATSVLPLDLDQIVARADRVVHVRCVGSEVQTDPVAGIVTVTTFDVLERAKGVASPSLVLRQVGGELNGLKVDYHVPSFDPGQEYVLFVPAASEAGLASPVGLAQGVFDVVPGAQGKEVGNGRDFAELLPAATPANVPAGVAKRLARAPQERKRMDLVDFMALVRARAGTR